MLPRRGRLEILIAASVLAALLGAAVGRMPRLEDDALRGRSATAAANFEAGLSLQQAESRARGDAGLNALGYPTGASGTIASAADCRSIWSRVMVDGSATVNAHFVADADGSGDRCEFVVGGHAGAALRIVYWPLGSNAALATVAGRAVHVGAGEHVYVAEDDAESASRG